MSFLNKVKTNYKLKMLKEHLLEKNYENANSVLLDIKIFNSEEYKSFIYSHINSLIEKKEFKNLFSSNNVWINSFFDQDLKDINNFICSYFQDCLISSENELDNFNFYNKVLSILNQREYDQLFNSKESFIQSHYYFHQKINEKSPNKINIINSQSAFFELNNKLRFTHKNFTRCFIYIIRNPVSIFQSLKKFGYNSKDALNAICNLDNQDISISINERDYLRKYTEIRKSWKTNVLSWSSEKTISALNGIVIKYEDLINKPAETLNIVLNHLEFFNKEIVIKNDMLQKYSHLIQNMPKEDLAKINISNQEKKIIRRELGEVAEKFNYDI